MMRAFNHNKAVVPRTHMKLGFTFPVIAMKPKAEEAISFPGIAASSASGGLLAMTACTPKLLLGSDWPSGRQEAVLTPET
jgi:hypothetical protein